MKIGIFDPYLDSLGGGERYTMSLAEYLSGQGHRVDVFWDDASIVKKAEDRLSLDLKRVNFVDNIFYSPRNLLKKLIVTSKYDLFFWLSDGSIPFLFARKNILHFQVPFKGVGGKSVLNRIKLKKFSRIICNSHFTQKYIDREYGVRSQVIYPPAAMEDFKSGKKENIILAVGRFSRTLHAKKQEILIHEFKRMVNSKLEAGSWKLVLAGGVLDEDREYIKKLKKQAKGYPIEIETNIHFNQLKWLYGKAKIFWHAAGFGENEKKHPERMEHFGIAVVEAMAAGCVPVVIKKGGLPEIVSHGVNGLLWKTKVELAKKTLQLIKAPKMMKKMSLQSIKASQKFSKKVFCQKIDELI